MRVIADEPEPRRIVEQSGELGDLVRGFVRQTDTDVKVFVPSAYAAWRAGQGARRAQWNTSLVSPVRGALAALVLVGSSVGLAVHFRQTGGGSGGLLAAPLGPPVPSPSVQPPVVEAHEGVTARAESHAVDSAQPRSPRREHLAPGVTDIGTEARVTLSKDGLADVVQHGGAPWIELRRGRSTFVSRTGARSRRFG